MRISGAGCCVLDVLHEVPPGEGQARLAPYLSRAPGDGGLVRGAAVLRSALEAHAGRPVTEIAAEIAGAGSRTTLGGVAAAAVVAGAQIVRGEGIEVRLYANLSDDEDGALVRRLLSRTPLSTARLSMRRGRYPKTHILNERGDGGVAERSFIAEAGVSDALALAPEDLDRDFFESEVALFSAIWWEPRLCARLTDLLAACRRAGAVTVVGTAFAPARGRGAIAWGAATTSWAGWWPPSRCSAGPAGRSTSARQPSSATSRAESPAPTPGVCSTSATLARSGTSSFVTGPSMSGSSPRLGLEGARRRLRHLEGIRLRHRCPQVV